MLTLKQLFEIYDDEYKTGLFLNLEDCLECFIEECVDAGYIESDYNEFVELLKKNV